MIILRVHAVKSRFRRCKTIIYTFFAFFFLLAHFDLCKGKSSRLKKDTQMQSMLKFTQTTKKRGAPEACEAECSNKAPKPSEDSDVDNSDRETE